MGTRQQEDSLDYNILEDIGGGFLIGGVGGSAFNFLKGVYNSPSGARLVGGSRAFLTNAPGLPRIAGSFGIFFGLQSALGLGMIHARGKEDCWDSIIPAAAACGVLNMHRGLGASARWALSAGAIAAAIEGTYIMADKVEAKRNATKFWSRIFEP